MNSHQIRLHPAQFQVVKSGAKIIESRINDEKRRSFRVGDELEFVSRESGEILKSTIVALHRFTTFEELMASQEISKFAHNSAENALKEIHSFYDEAKIMKYGVVGIEFRLT